MPDNPTPDMLKKMKIDVASPQESVSGAIPTNNGSMKNGGKARVATMEEVEDEDMDRTFAPGGDADYFAEEDDEGRFFGGGLTFEQKEILTIFENASGEGVQGEVRDQSPSRAFQYLNHFQSDNLSITAIRRLLLRFERAVNKNQEQRSKHPDDPTK
jgi:beta-catenin-like protein 1